MNVQNVDTNGKTVISTFAGIGGSSLGYKLAGYNELLAIDFDDYCEQIFKLNFSCPFWNKNIRDVKGKDILDFCNIKKGELFCLDGSPPCQGFSTAGQRKVTDKRNELYKEFIRLINELKPKYFVMENVSGQIKGRMRGYFNEILRDLKATSYNIRVKLLNAKYYSVPQSRERIFYIGGRDSVPEFPEPSLDLISIKDIVKRDGYIKYRHNYSKGSVHFKKHYFNKPCLTITKVNTWDVQPKMFTIDEVKQLCSFPGDFKLEGSFEKQWGGLGNAVMPLQMKAIAECLS